MDTGKKAEKKSETLDIRLPYAQKRAFMQATGAQGETASEAIRAFISDYIDQAHPTEPKNPVQDFTMTLARHKLKTLTSALAASLGFIALTTMPSAADSAFDHLDANKDGLITEGEILPGQDADIIAQLDTDASGGVTPEELEAAGDTIIVEKSETETDADGTEKVRQKVKVLKFGDDTDGDVITKIDGAAHKEVRIVKTGEGTMSDADIEAIIKRYTGSTLEEAEVDIIVK